MKKKIVILCDHAKRDLVGNALLANKLLDHDYIVYIIPIFESEYQILKIWPDSIILCYARKNNEKLINLLGFLGIKMYVSETEGIPYDMEEFSRQISNEKIYNKVNTYFLWGETQYNKISSRVGLVDKFKVVGCARYDKILKNNKVYKGDRVLINTNFTVANPKFTKSKKEELINRAAFGTGINHINALDVYSDKVFSGALDAIEKIVSTNQSIQFALRPHPFESELPYKYLSKYLNFKISEELTSIEDIQKSKAIIHINCQTAIEAVILGRPAYSLSWLYQEKMGNFLSRNISIKINSIEELNNYLYKKSIPEIQEYSDVIKSYIANVFSGDACSKIVDFIKKDKTNVEKSYINKLAAIIYLTRIILKMILGKKVLQLISKKKNGFDKYFSRDDFIKSAEIYKNATYKFNYSNIKKDKVICLKIYME